MNKSDVSDILNMVTNEIGFTESQIEYMAVRKTKLEAIEANLKNFIDHHVELQNDGSQEPQRKATKSRISPAGLRGILKAQKKRREREKFEALGKMPLEEPKKTGRSRKSNMLHWTQRPENARRVQALARKMSKIRIAKAA